MEIFRTSSILPIIHPIKATQRANPAIQRLSEAEEKIVKELQKRDREVRAHESAHQRTAGQYATGGAQFKYKFGPDGKRYAVSGEVKLDVSAIKGDPEATISKMETIARAALAPADPSAQDRRIANEAKQRILEKEAELRSQEGEQVYKLVNDMENQEPGLNLLV